MTRNITDDFLPKLSSSLSLGFRSTEILSKELPGLETKLNQVYDLKQELDKVIDEARAFRDRDLNEFFNEFSGPEDRLQFENPIPRGDSEVEFTVRISPRVGLPVPLRVMVNVGGLALGGQFDVMLANEFSASTRARIRETADGLRFFVIPSSTTVTYTPKINPDEVSIGGTIANVLAFAGKVTVILPSFSFGISDRDEEIDLNQLVAGFQLSTPAGVDPELVFQFDVGLMPGGGLPLPRFGYNKQVAFKLPTLEVRPTPDSVTLDGQPITNSDGSVNKRLVAEKLFESIKPVSGQVFGAFNKLNEIIPPEVRDFLLGDVTVFGNVPLKEILGNNSPLRLLELAAGPTGIPPVVFPIAEQVLKAAKVADVLMKSGAADVDKLREENSLRFPLIEQPVQEIVKLFRNQLVDLVLLDINLVDLLPPSIKDQFTSSDGKRLVVNVPETNLASIVGDRFGPTAKRIVELLGDITLEGRFELSAILQTGVDTRFIVANKPEELLNSFFVRAGDIIDFSLTAAATLDKSLPKLARASISVEVMGGIRFGVCDGPELIGGGRDGKLRLSEFSGPGLSKFLSLTGEVVARARGSGDLFLGKSFSEDTGRRSLIAFSAECSPGEVVGEQPKPRDLFAELKGRILQVYGTGSSDAIRIEMFNTNPAASLPTDNRIRVIRGSHVEVFVPDSIDSIAIDLRGGRLTRQSAGTDPSDGGDDSVVLLPNLPATLEVTVFGGSGSDILTAGDGPGSFFGGRVNFFGGGGNDRLIGAGERSLLDGEAGRDELIGGPGQATLRGGIDDDTLNVENNYGLNALVQAVDGGEGSDQLVLQGRLFIQSAYEVTGPGSGTIVSDGRDLLYQGIEIILDNNMVIDRVFSVAASFLGDHRVRLGDDDDPDNQRSVIRPDIGGVAFSHVTFVNPTNSLTVNSGVGNNVIALALLDSSYVADTILNGESGLDTINILAAPGGTTTFANGNDGNDSVTVGDAINALDNILGEVVVNGGAATDQFTVLDSSAAPNSYTVSARTVTKLGGPVVTYVATEQVRLAAGDNVDAVNVVGTLRDTQVTVDTGGGDDVIDVGTAGSIDGVRGSLVVSGGAGNNVLNLNDHSDPDANDFRINAAEVIRRDAAIAYNGVQQLNVRGGPGRNLFEVTPSAITTIAIAAGPPQDPADLLRLNAENRDLTASNGRLAVAERRPVTFDGIEQLDLTNVMALIVLGDEQDNALTVNADDRNSGTYLLDGGPPATVRGIDSFRWNALEGDDTLTINNPTGSLFGPPGGITLDAGGQDGDRLLFLGGGGPDFDATYSGGPGERDGVLAFAGPVSMTLSFTGLALLTDTSASRLFTAVGTDAPDVIRLDDGEDDGDGLLRFSVGAHTPAQFRNKGEIVINAGLSADAVLVQFTEAADALRSVRLNAGAGDDHATIGATAAGVTTFVRGEVGRDFVNVGGALDLTLDRVLGPVEIDATLPDRDVLVINDQNDPDGNVYGIRPGGLFTRNNGPTLVRFGPLESLSVNGGQGNDGVFVAGSPAGAPVTVNAGGGDDVVQVDSNAAAAGGTASGVLGVLTVNGQGGTNTLLLVHSDGAAPVHVTVTPSQIGAAPGDTLFGPGGGLLYTGIAAAVLDLPGLPSGDVVRLSPSTATQFFVNGNLPTFPTRQGDALFLDLVGVPSRRLLPTGRGNGVWTFGGGFRPVAFTSFEKLNHVDVIAVGADAGAGPHVKVFDAETRAGHSQLRRSHGGVH